MPPSSITTNVVIIIIPNQFFLSVVVSSLSRSSAVYVIHKEKISERRMLKAPS